jgi:hypothetical protein
MCRIYTGERCAEREWEKEHFEIVACIALHFFEAKIRSLQGSILDHLFLRKKFEIQTQHSHGNRFYDQLKSISSFAALKSPFDYRLYLYPIGLKPYFFPFPFRSKNSKTGNSSGTFAVLHYPLVVKPFIETIELMYVEGPPPKK